MAEEKETPLFIKIENYKEVIELMRTINKRVEEAKANLERIYTIKSEEDIKMVLQEAYRMLEYDQVPLVESKLNDYLAIKFQGNRGYSAGLLPLLERLEKQGKIELLKVKRLFFGSLYMEGYNTFVWKKVK